MKTLLIILGLIKRKKQTTILLTIEICICLIAFNGLIDSRMEIKKKAAVVNTFEDNDIYYFGWAKYLPSDFELKKVIPVDILENMQIGSVGLMNIKLKEGGGFGALSYSKLIADNLNYDLKSGVNFSKSDSDYIKGIWIGDRYKTGDIIETDNGAKIEIIGVMPIGSYAVSCTSGGGNGASSLDSFVKAAEKEGLLIEEAELLSKYMYGEQRCKIIDIKDDERRDEIIGILRDYGTISSIKEMRDNYKYDNDVDRIVNMVLFVVFSVVTMAGIVAVNGIQAKKNTKIYAIYYMCGMSPKKNIMIEAISTSLVMMIAFMVFNVITHVGFVKNLFVILYLFGVYFISSAWFVFKASKHDLMVLYKE
ncbi:MAG TPA: hypothetical protein DCX21_03280 [Eubacterium sp.]|nr:hypothetical protein [Eubacterium sp.]HBZ52437.1 hypothetical protein [Eubacterium sp.]